MTDAEPAELRAHRVVDGWDGRRHDALGAEFEHLAPGRAPVVVSLRWLDEERGLVAGGELMVGGRLVARLSGEEVVTLLEQDMDDPDG